MGTVSAQLHSVQHLVTGTFTEREIERERECWLGDTLKKNIKYFCGNLVDPKSQRLLH